MGFFTVSSKFVVYLFSPIFGLAGLALLALGLFMRFDNTQWDTVQATDNGTKVVYIYMGLGAAMFLLCALGIRGARKAGHRFSLFLFQLGTLVCLVVSIYGAVILFDVVSESTTIKGVSVGQVNSGIASNLTPEQVADIHKYQRSFAIFLACVAGAEGLMLLASFILCFQKPETALPTHYQRHGSPNQQSNQVWTCSACSKANNTPDKICSACFTKN
jgi:uncharacterized membrane protein YeaQ/YmgE (transglycosylase-associated protein family)